MAQMIVNVPFLNQRTSIPPTLTDTTSVVNKLPNGTLLDVNLVTTVLNPALGDWYTDGQFFYWGKGLVNASPSVINPSLDFQNYINQCFDGAALKTTIDYSQLLNVDQQYKNKFGEGVTIAIIDDPISSGIQSSIPIQRPYPTGDPLVSFHGDFIFGLIAGIQNIIGVCNKVSVVSLPIYDQYGNTIPNGIERALNYIGGISTPMIINISDTFGSNYDQIINNFSSNKIIVSCAGVNQDLNSDTSCYPASNGNVIAVGAIDSDFALNGIKRKVDFLLPNFSYVSFDSNNNYSKQQGDSFSTAIVSAFIALIISTGNVDYDVDAIKKILRLNSAQLPDSSTFNSLNLMHI